MTKLFLRVEVSAVTAHRCGTEVAPFCENPFKSDDGSFSDRFFDPHDDIPACGCAKCDIPANVLRFQADLTRGTTPQVTINTTVYLLANDSGYALISPQSIEENFQLVNAAFKPFNISFAPTITLFNNSFLYSRYVLPFCQPADIGDGTCLPFCNVTMTGYDGGDCVHIPPNANCSARGGDGTCDDECNYMQFQWDGGDCCAAAIAAQHCRDPASPLRMWLSQTLMPTVVNATGVHSFNIYIAQYAECEWCGASSNMPWWYNFTEPSQQGSIFNSATIGLQSMGQGLVLVHELGHTFGLWHVFRFAESGTAPCPFACFDGVQYPVGQNGSMLTGDLCEDTRPSTFNFMCADPPGNDCAGSPWTDTPLHNYMSFTYLSAGCANEFTLQQGARMRCYLQAYYTGWFIETEAV